MRIAHDFGQSFSPAIDRGQREGAAGQGIGWMTLEEVSYSDEGRLLSNSLNSYEIPDFYSVPAVLDMHFLDTPGHPNAILRAKAVGEPPLMYGIGAYFALRAAGRAFRPGISLTLVAPRTPKRVLGGLYPEMGRGGATRAPATYAGRRPARMW